MDNLIFLQLPRVGEGCQTLGIDFDFTGRRFQWVGGRVFAEGAESDVVLLRAFFLKSLSVSSLRNPAFPGYAL